MEAVRAFFSISWSVVWQLLLPATVHDERLSLRGGMGRTDSQEIALFESMGPGMLDVSMAIAVYDAVRKSLACLWMDKKSMNRPL